VGQTLAEANLRAKTGASIVAILREGYLIANPKSVTIFQAGDRVGLIGDTQEIDAVGTLMSMSEQDHPGSERFVATASTPQHP
jgi:CPA2 family monovalent cation:H+ antiporter-2